MSRTSLLIAALLVIPACDRGSKTDADGRNADNDAPPGADPAAPAGAHASDVPATGAAPPVPAEPTPDPWAQTLAGRVLAPSGLGPDGRLTAFDIVNGESGEQYCQICRFGRSPKLMAVGTVDDEAFHEDLKDIDAIVKKYGDDKIKAFAVITDIVDGKGVTPDNVEQAQAQAHALRQKLAISIPVVVPAPGKDGPNREWDEYYNITQSRTVMFADGRNAVKYSAVGPEDFSALNDAIVSVLQG